MILNALDVGTVVKIKQKLCNMYCDQRVEEVITALRQALETEQQPVAWANSTKVMSVGYARKLKGGT